MTLIIHLTLFGLTAILPVIHQPGFAWTEEDSHVQLPSSASVQKKQRLAPFQPAAKYNIV